MICRHFILIEDCTPGCPKHGYELVENTVGMPKSDILVRVYCHNTEEVQRISMDTEFWDDEDLMKACQRARWFEPKEQVQA